MSAWPHFLIWLSLKPYLPKVMKTHDTLQEWWRSENINISYPYTLQGPGINFA